MAGIGQVRDRIRQRLGRCLSHQDVEDRPADVWLEQPETTPPLANLAAMSVTAVTGSTIQVSANATPPSGGGFEVGRRDWAFCPGDEFRSRAAQSRSELHHSARGRHRTVLRSRVRRLNAAKLFEIFERCLCQCCSVTRAMQMDDGERA